MPTRQLIGAHLSTSKGLPAMLQTAVELGCACAQIFTSSPQQWRGKKYMQAEADAFKAAQAATGVAPVVSHESYLINLASLDAEILEKSRNAFREEIARCGLLGLPMLVMHWGSCKGGPLAEGIARLAGQLIELIPLADGAGVQIVLEATAGQGSYMGGSFAEFPQLFAQIPAHEHLGVCLDTAHAFAAGYDLRDAAAYRALWEEFTRHIDLRRLKVIHMNDTDKALGSHADRHAHIGQGQLGLEAFRLLMRDERLVDIPKILETPGGEESHAANLRVLRELAGE
ncbi:MAG: deoxyribonuclease IV [Armatimonadota bacterium]